MAIRAGCRGVLTSSLLIMMIAFAGSCVGYSHEKVMVSASTVTPGPSTAPTSAETLHGLLASLLLKYPKTIEILPGDGSLWIPSGSQNPENTNTELSFSPFLLTDGNLGVPQKVLYQVYLYAVDAFKSVRSRVPTLPTMDTHDLDESLIHILITSSSILILANPSHETALNARKVLVRMRLIDPQAELRLMGSLLSSQHCAKHAELWYHRRWLLRPGYGMHSPGPRLHFASPEMVHQELELASRACELYPRNYFAWTHRAICMRSLLTDYLTGMDTVGFVPIFRCEISRTKEWIDRHVSDYSAIHSILILCQAAFESKHQSLVGAVIEEGLVDHARSLVQEYPTHEALWIYIQSALSISDTWQAQQTKQFVDCFVLPLASSQHLGDELLKASYYAKQFLKRKKMPLGQFTVNLICYD